MSPIRILVVDDLPDVCVLFQGLARRIRGVDVEVTTQTSGRRAIRMLEEGPFDLVVSDFRLRDVDGLDVLRAARRANPEGHRILMTGYNEVPASLERIEEARVDAYLRKPMDAQDLLLVLLDFARRNASAIDEFRRHAREMERDARHEAYGAQAAG